MVVTVRVLIGVTVIAQLVTMAAILHARRMFEASVYGDERASLLALAALAVLVLVWMTTTIVAAIHVWEVGGTLRWTCWAAGLLCLVAQGYALIGSHLVGYLVVVGLYAVAGLALGVSLGSRWDAVVPPVSGEPVVPGPAGIADGREPDLRAVDVSGQ